MSKKQNLTDKLSLDKEADPAILKAAKDISKLIDVMPQLLQLEMMKAKIMKARFDELIKAGFNEQQALTIVSNRKAFE